MGRYHRQDEWTLALVCIDTIIIMRRGSAWNELDSKKTLIRTRDVMKDAKKRETVEGSGAYSRAYVNPSPV